MALPAPMRQFLWPMAIPNFMIPFRLIDLRLTELAARLWRPLVCSLLMGALVMLIRPVVLAILAPRAGLLLLVGSGVLVYTVTGWLINREQARQALGATGLRLSIR